MCSALSAVLWLCVERNIYIYSDKMLSCEFITQKKTISIHFMSIQPSRNKSATLRQPTAAVSSTVTEVHSKVQQRSGGVVWHHAQDWLRVRVIQVKFINSAVFKFSEWITVQIKKLHTFRLGSFKDKYKLRKSRNSHNHVRKVKNGKNVSCIKQHPCQNQTELSTKKKTIKKQ